MRARKADGVSLRGSLSCEYLPRAPCFVAFAVRTICLSEVLTLLNSLFLGIASYLIFGSWLNYNRYGARGWDLLPHGDTIRDVPYLFKDWIRKVVSTVQGGGSRGGYSAV